MTEAGPAAPGPPSTRPPLSHLRNGAEVAHRSSWEEGGNWRTEVTGQGPPQGAKQVRPACRACPTPPVCRHPDPLSDRRYRKVVSSACEGGVDPRQSPAQLQCPLLPPRGLQVSIRGEAVAVRPGEDVLFMVRQEQVRAASGPAGALVPSPRGHVRWADGTGCRVPFLSRRLRQRLPNRSRCSRHRPRRHGPKHSVWGCVLTGRSYQTHSFLWEAVTFFNL